MSVSINLHAVTEIVAEKPRRLYPEIKGDNTWITDIVFTHRDGEELTIGLFAKSEEALFVNTDGTVVITGDENEDEDLAEQLGKQIYSGSYDE